MNSKYHGSKMHLGQWIEFLRAYDENFNALDAIQDFRRRFH